MLAFTSLSPIVNASQSNDVLPDQIISSGLSEELIEIVNPHVEISGKTFVLVNVKELKSKITNKEYQLVRKSI
ncbi:hypothetical protein KHA80_04145 [Anaerobacillus sp. HL2]|nr:hypothetical protein KHA80_04145 [Anaerobacillus sp. HL2]